MIICGKHSRSFSSPVLRIKDIIMWVGNEPEATPLLQEVSFHIPAGHLVAIVGPSGSGKSTLLKVIAGVCEPDMGSLHWNGRNLAEQDLAPHEIGDRKSTRLNSS